MLSRYFSSVFVPTTVQYISVRTSFRQSLLNKKEAEKKKKDSVPDPEGHDSFLKRCTLFHNKPDPDFDNDFGRKRFKVAQKLTMNYLRENNIRSKARNIRIKLKWAAVNALPTPCREAALIQDNNRLPSIPTLVDFPAKPPSEGGTKLHKSASGWKFTSRFVDDVVADQEKRK